MSVQSPNHSPGHSQALSVRRQWALAFVATFCGFVAAFNIGKVPAAIPLIRDEFSISLSGAGALASAYSVMAMLFSLVFGMLVSRHGSWRIGAAGLCLLVFGGILGAVSPAYVYLLASRVLEGFGFVAIAVAMPAFIGRVCEDRIRPMAMGLWGTFISGGVSCSLLLSPLLLHDDRWRALWWAGSLTALLGLAIAAYTLRPAWQRLPAPAAMKRPRVSSVLSPTSLMLTGCFVLYSAIFVSMTTFLPNLWLDTANLSLATATRLTAVVVIMNLFGNLTGGWLNGRGVPIRLVLAIALFGGGLSACLVTLDSLPVTGQLLAACCCSYLGGMLPATLFASVARIAQTPAHNGLLLGLFFQGAGVGQVFGPLLLGAVIDHYASWQASPLFYVAVMLPGAMLLWSLRIARPNHQKSKP